jgi:hypothetical protein
MWVVQEVAAASIPTVWCGKRRAAWEDLHAASLLLMMHWDSARNMCEEFGIEFDFEQKAKEVHDGSRCQDIIHPRYNITSAHKFSYLRQMSLLKKPLSFLFLALLHRDSECTDVRDKIYALWNLAKDAGGPDLVPDYSLSIRDLYISFTKQYILHHRCLNIICAPEVRCIAPPEGGLPSWVLDWRTRSHVNGYLLSEVLPITHADELADLHASIYRAARSTKAIISFSENDEWLVCGGILMDTISLIASESENPYDWYPIALKHCHCFGKETPEEQVDRDFWNMIFGEVDAEKRGHVLHEIQKEKVHKTAQILSDQNVITPNI